MEYMYICIEYILWGRGKHFPGIILVYSSVVLRKEETVKGGRGSPINMVTNNEFKYTL